MHVQDILNILKNNQEYLKYKFLLKICSFLSAFLLLRLIEYHGLLWEYNIGLTFMIVDMNLRYVFVKRMSIQESGKITSIIFLVYALILTPILTILNKLEVLYFAIFILSNLSLQNLEYTQFESPKLKFLLAIRALDIILLSFAQIFQKLLYIFLLYKALYLIYSAIASFRRIKLLQRVRLNDWRISAYSMYHFSLISLPLYFLAERNEEFWVYRIVVGAVIGLLPSFAYGYLSDKMVDVKPSVNSTKLIVIVGLIMLLFVSAFVGVLFLDYMNIFQLKISYDKLILLILFNIFLVINDLLTVIINNYIGEKSMNIFILLIFLFYFVFFYTNIDEWQYVIMATVSLSVLSLFRMRYIRWERF